MNEITLQTLVRPAVTLTFAATFCLGFAFGSIDSNTFTTMAGVVVTWWFKTRDEKKGSDQ